MRTATGDSTTPTRLPVRERALVIPHALTPAEVEALIKVGEHLANISTRLTAMMEACGPAIVKPSRELAESIIRFLDEVDPDPDLEPSLAGLNCALGLGGWHDGRDRNSDQTHWSEGTRFDQEEEHDGREPGEDEELFGDEGDPWDVPLRLDAYAEPAHLLSGKPIND